MEGLDAGGEATEMIGKDKMDWGYRGEFMGGGVAVGHVPGRASDSARRPSAGKTKGDGDREGEGEKEGEH